MDDCGGGSHPPLDPGALIREILRCVCWVLTDVSDVCVCSGGCTSPGPLSCDPDGSLCPLGSSACPIGVLLGLWLLRYGPWVSGMSFCGPWVSRVPPGLSICPVWVLLGLWLPVWWLHRWGYWYIFNRGITSVGFVFTGSTLHLGTLSDNLFLLLNQATLLLDVYRSWYSFIGVAMSSTNVNAFIFASPI